MDRNYRKNLFKCLLFGKTIFEGTLWVPSFFWVIRCPSLQKKADNR